MWTAEICTLVASSNCLFLLTSSLGLVGWTRTNAIMSCNIATMQWTLLYMNRGCHQSLDFDFAEAACSLYQYSPSSTLIVIARGKRGYLRFSANDDQYSRSMVLFHVEKNIMLYPDTQLPKRPTNINFEFDERACTVELERESNHLVSYLVRTWVPKMLIPCTVKGVIVRFCVEEAMVIVTAQDQWLVRLCAVLKRLKQLGVEATFDI